MAQTFKHTHGCYASYCNHRHLSSGHLWQRRFYSCPLHDSDLSASLRYVELNPVRARMVQAAEQWRWSSAAAHCSATSDVLLEMGRWRRRWTEADWVKYLAAGESSADLTALRRCTYSGRPLGTPEFVAALEKSTLRMLAPRKGGRPKKPSSDPKQAGLAFVA